MTKLYSEEFKSLLQNPHWANRFIGYGDPDAKILIVGKECAIDKNNDHFKMYEHEYLQNFTLWRRNVNGMVSTDSVKNWISNPDWGIFNPLAPFKGQLFKVRTNRFQNKGTSRTWYNYQKLINLIRGMGKLDTPQNTSTIDFYKDCFITELNDQPRANNKEISVEESDEIEENIKHRFDMMKETSSFWAHFQTVILACGPYADALRKKPELKNAIFGNARVISEAKGRKIPQLSSFISNGLLWKIAEQF